MAGHVVCSPASNERLCCASLVEAPLNEAEAAKVARVLAALADPVRLRLLSLIATRSDIGRVAASIKNLKAERAQLANEVERLLDDFHLRAVVISMPGVGAKTAATILQAIGDTSAFPSAAHLAAYAGIAPITRRSGKSIRGEHPTVA